LSTNRELAVELLGVADLWIFATTGTDYADAVPWDLLTTITERRVTVAGVLNRIRPQEGEAVRKHFAQMLVECGAGDAPVFTIPELALADARIPYAYLAPLHDWLDSQVSLDSLREGYLDFPDRADTAAWLIAIHQRLSGTGHRAMADAGWSPQTLAIATLTLLPAVERCHLTRTAPRPRPCASSRLRLFRWGCRRTSPRSSTPPRQTWWNACPGCSPRRSPDSPASSTGPGARRISRQRCELTW
jgi:hypothetical protein